VLMDVADSVMDKDGHVDPAALATIGRMGGDGYVATTDRFDLRRPGSASGGEGHGHGAAVKPETRPENWKSLRGQGPVGSARRKPCCSPSKAWYSTAVPLPRKAATMHSAWLGGTILSSRP